jgi:ribosome maturation factor RimP
MITKELVRKLAQERIDELDRGLFIVSISISPKFVINLELDKFEGYVAIDDCVSVSRNVEHNLDREEQDFELHVSSAGLDKPLRVLPQFIKNIGRTVEVTTKDGKTLEGELLEASDEKLVMKTTRTEKSPETKKKVTIVEDSTLLMANIKETKIVISFK